MMKILQVNCVYGNGSTGQIVQTIHKGLQQCGMESVACYGRGKRASDPHTYKICSDLYAKVNNVISRITGVMYGGCILSTTRLIQIIKKEQPDVVHLHCINGYFVNIYRLVEWLKKSGIKTVVTLHAEFMYTANCGHALDCEKWKAGCGNCPRCREETKSLFWDNTARSFRKLRRAFAGFDKNLMVTSVSPWLMERAKQSLILGEKQHCVVMNGVDTDIFHPYTTEELRKKHQLRGEKVIFHATPCFNDDPQHLKGGYYIIRLAELLKDQNVKVVVAGRHPKDLKVPENMILLGNISDRKELAKYYSLADVTVITSKKETFSMVVAESLCCGTPVVGFKAGGPEQIAIAEHSAFADWSDVEGLLFDVQKMLMNRQPSDYISKNAEKFYSKAMMVKNYLQIYVCKGGS